MAAIHTPSSQSLKMFANESTMSTRPDDPHGVASIIADRAFPLVMETYLYGSSALIILTNDA